MSIVKRFPSPLEQELSDDIWEMCDAEEDATIVFNALLLTLARFFSLLPANYRSKMGAHLTETAPDMLRVADKWAEDRGD
jgi:hypothetical protein